MKAKSLNFIPITTSYLKFSLDDLSCINQVVEENEGENTVDKEYLILNFLHALGSDKERCIFLIEILRELGYKFDYESTAKALHIEWRWYMRVKAEMKKILQKNSDSHI